MFFSDLIRFSLHSITAQKLRASLTILGIGVGIATVVLLTSLGVGVQRFVLAEFTQFGSTLIAINPGRPITRGISIGAFGTVRPLTLDDANALTKVPQSLAVVPLVQGNAEAAASTRRRRTTVYGVGPEFPTAFNFRTQIGTFLPRDNPESPRAFTVLGYKLSQELFPNSNPLGQLIRIGGYRYRIVGVMESKGQFLGFDLDDSIYIPAARALQLFKRDSLMEIDLLYQEGVDADLVVDDIRKILVRIHGREDFTITTQQQMLDVFDSVMELLTFAVSALGGISLIVGGVGILTIMTIASRERTSEIGLLIALGAEQHKILGIFLGEAILLSALGGVFGTVLGVGGAYLLHWFVPNLPVHTPLHYLVIAEIVAISIGLVAGVMPARFASRLNPVDALRTE